jgi:ABC-type glycerol-3-phosphate transport system substrate-binding protein
MEGKANCGVVFLLGIALIGCRQPPREPVALQYTYSWNEDRPQERALLLRFTRETGIPVTNISVPEASREYVDLARKLLQSGSGPDLLNIDLIWTAVLAPDLVDLQPYLAPEIARVDPELLRS